MIEKEISPGIWPALAQELGVAEAVLRAVAEVESRGEGFIPNTDLPKILFEAHYFHRLTGGRWDRTNPNISAPYNILTSPKLYKGGILEWFRLREAEKLDRGSALQSASWGAFQIMGANFAAAGYKSVNEFVQDQEAGADEQVKGFAGFCKNAAGGKLLQALREKNPRQIAFLYNGPQYALGKYDVKIQVALAKWERILAAPPSLPSEAMVT